MRVGRVRVAFYRGDACEHRLQNSGKARNVADHPCACSGAGAAAMESASRVPCDARMADGAIRGSFVGLLWAGVYGPGEYSASLGPKPHVLPFALRYSALCVVSFASFFGVYCGLLCRTGRIFGNESPASSTIAGGAIGCAIGACLPPRAPNALMVGAMTALVSGATAMVVQPRRGSAGRP